MSFVDIRVVKLKMSVMHCKEFKHESLLLFMHVDKTLMYLSCFTQLKSNRNFDEPISRFCISKQISYHLHDKQELLGVFCSARVQVAAGNSSLSAALSESTVAFAV